MFLDNINELERAFDLLDKANNLIFTIWRDDNAETFFDTYIKVLEIEYRKYVTTMRQRSNTLKTQMDQLESLYREFQNNCHHKISDTYERERQEIINRNRR